MAKKANRRWLGWTGAVRGKSLRARRRSIKAGNLAITHLNGEVTTRQATAQELVFQKKISTNSARIPRSSAILTPEEREAMAAVLSQPP